MMTEDAEGCPPRDTIIEAAGPGSDQAVRERVTDHLIACAACADEFRLLQALAPWAAEHAHLVAQSNATAPRPTTRRSAAMVWAYAAAAVLVLTTLGLTIEVRRLAHANRMLETQISRVPARRSVNDGPPPAASRDQEARLADQQRTITTLEQRLRAAEAPDVNPPIIDLEAADSLRSGDRVERTTIPGDARHVVFVLNTAHVRPGAVFEVDIVDAGHRVVWTGSGLKQSADGTLTLMVPRLLVGPSSRVRLYTRTASRASRRALVEEYVLPARP